LHTPSNSTMNRPVSTGVPSDVGLLLEPLGTGGSVEDLDEQWTRIGWFQTSDPTRRDPRSGDGPGHLDRFTPWKTFYGPAIEVVTSPIPIKGLPPVAGDFRGEPLQAAVFDSQRNGQRFRGFTHRAMESGVLGCFAFLRGRRITCFGRPGDQRTEWFPETNPTSDSPEGQAIGSPFPDQASRVGNPASPSRPAQWPGSTCSTWKNPAGPEKPLVSPWNRRPVRLVRRATGSQRWKSPERRSR